jgi:hypothetical protein
MKSNVIYNNDGGSLRKNSAEEWTNRNQEFSQVTNKRQRSERNVVYISPINTFIEQEMVMTTSHHSVSSEFKNQKGFLLYARTYHSFESLDLYHVAQSF